MLALAITADLSGVTDLQPEDTEDSPFYYTFKETNEQSGSRGDANFVWRCKNCKREHSANMIETPKSYPQQSPPKPKNIITMDCRGLEFLEFKPDGAWKAIGTESGTKFSDIDLTEGDWYDYDEKVSEEVSIKDVKWEIRRA
ncbi:hypothetical protein B0A50_00461 [Salinomyces thailandicus]|uniref:DUF866 domain-containing protein n=1 Tax=Salinomyces thailandicus TaxID=706561 RepID=A0A4U0UGL6_9PEZI|nr:hypothetical protein B0A50_00461 [Salinomyces thailandica]